MQSNAEKLRYALSHWEEQGSGREFFQLVAHDVTWHVSGSTPMSGTYEGRRSFLASTQPFMERLAEPIAVSVSALHDTGGDIVVLEWVGSSRGRNGRPYEQSYCWVVRFHDGLIAEVTAYLDTALVNDMFVD